MSVYVTNKDLFKSMEGKKVSEVSKILNKDMGYIQKGESYYLYKLEKDAKAVASGKKPLKPGNALKPSSSLIQAIEGKCTEVEMQK